MEGVLSCVTEKMQGFRKELAETQVDLQAVKTSFDTRKRTSWRP
jgi:hypothetical protein